MSLARWSAEEAGLIGFVLIFLGIEFEVEQAREIASRAARAATSAALRTEGYLDLAESGFGAQQILKSFLLGLDRVVPLLLLELRGSRIHGLRGGSSCRFRSC